MDAAPGGLAAEDRRWLAAAWKVERQGKSTTTAGTQGVDAKQVETWARWLRAADEKARGSYLKDLLAGRRKQLRKSRASIRKNTLRLRDSSAPGRNLARKVCGRSGRGSRIAGSPKPDADTFFVP